MLLRKSVQEMYGVSTKLLQCNLLCESECCLLDKEEEEEELIDLSYPNQILLETKKCCASFDLMFP